MIIILNREMMIPNEERYIGTDYDDHSENREFRIPRINSGGTDLCGLGFTLDMEFFNGQTNAVSLQKTYDEDYIYLTWNIERASLTAGTVQIQIRGVDAGAMLKYATFMGTVYVEHAIGVAEAYPSGITELQQFEAAEEKRRVAENAREEAEEARAESYATYQEERQAVHEYRVLSESYAKGNTGARSTENIDNSKYYAEQAQLQATQSKEWYEATKASIEGILPSFSVNMTTGNLEYASEGRYTFEINTTTGNLEYTEV